MWFSAIKLALNAGTHLQKTSRNKDGYGGCTTHACV